ncbi:uncharacterized protein LOC123684537 [Harmonia axyridis]|uniref:uncharacterized protein LOC123684537 n=1 Tax=Harmonia axyridis TaxID=115357 RepID=UPI001E27664F|nr:uncharacterized protein LOC123684537 [Harmonia axyridis]XP_045479794.1 uncharacterized protein LOC123684537 [Harmonia axyridis]
MAQIGGDKMVLVQFLDILALSILVPAVPPTILKTGGTLMHLGCLMSLSAAVRLISSKICAELLKVSGKRTLLQYSLIISCFFNALLYLVSSCFYGIMLNRVLFLLFNQVPLLSSMLVSKEDGNQSALKNPLTQRLIAGLAGCAIVGSIIDSKGGFYVLVLLSTAISGIAAAIAMQDQPKEKEKEKQLTPSTVIDVLKKTYVSTMKDIRDIDIHFANWDALLTKSLLVINAKVVYILFVVLIIFVFQGKGSLVNATAAYQTIILSLSGIAFNKLNLYVNNMGNPKQILEKSLLACILCAFLLSCAPSYSFYLFMFIPFVISRAFIEYYFIEVFETKKNQKLTQDLETVSTITEVVGPLFVGLVFQLLKHNAYRLLTVLPFVAIYYIVSKRVYREVKPEKTVETKEEQSKAKKDE